ncbi:MAG: hypothetical protein Q7R94_02835 [bacterium]|nr:hypothetical protein [bacterium]
MQLEELRDLKEARGLMILTTATLDETHRVLIETRNMQNRFRPDMFSPSQHKKLFSKELLICRARRPMKSKLVRVGNGVYEVHDSEYEVLRFHKHEGIVDLELQNKGFRTRLDFFIPRPTSAIYEVTKSLLDAGFSFAIPTPAGGHFLKDWAVFTPQTSTLPQITQASEGALMQE